MSYSRYKMLQKFVNGIPQQIFTQGDLIQAGPFDTYEECQEGNASPEVTPDNPDVLYRWIVSSTPWCDGTDEYKTEKQQQSSDSGKSWSDSGATRKGEFVQSYSFKCGFVAERWIEVNPSIDFICENGNKYYLQKKQISHDGVHWVDSGDTRKGPLIEADSADCGYPQYRWVEISLDVDYECVGDSKYYKEKEQITNDGIVWKDTGRTRKGRGAEVHSADCGYVPPTTVTRWVDVQGEFICQGTDKYQKEKEQISNDSGQTWSDTGNTRAGSLIERDSYSCGYVSFRWVDSPGEFVCQGYDKYQKQKEEKTTDGQVWTPTGRTRTGALIERNSYDCQYVSYRWVTVEGEFVCSGTDKYTKEKEQSSTDGQTWVDTGRERAGSLIERNSYSCGYVSYRWVVVTGEYVCQGYNKFAKEKEQSSTDGQTWTDTGRTRAGALIEALSEDCGYVPPTPVSSDYLTFTALEDGKFYFSKSVLYYSINDHPWSSLSYNNSTPTIAAGSKIRFKGTPTPSSSSPQGIGTFSSTGNFTVSGNIMSLLYGDDFDGHTNLSGENFAFYGLFSGCTKLISIDGLLLPATTLAKWCYEDMFSGCTGLTSIPSTLLPATTLEYSCYQGMFQDCTGLTSIPSTLLPATTLERYCYSGMFYGCTGLTSIPSGLLPATTLASYCYSSMFNSCDGLTSIPSNLLRAITLEEGCYGGMFANCTGLGSIPTGLLPATTLAERCYSSMFYGCTGLTSIPTGLLPATTLADYCYREMFRNCTGLTSIPSDLLPATRLKTYCYEYMFYGCTGLTSIPSTLLPATELAQYCYQYMFCKCTNITTAPNLTSTTLAKSCYYMMFAYCSNLNSIRMLATDISATDCLKSWVYNVASSGTFYKAEGVAIRTGESGIPEGWTVIEIIRRWVDVPGEFICQGTDKYQKQKERISEDSGQTWSDTGRTRAGALIEAQSEDCGYVPPTPVSSYYLTFTASEDGTFQFTKRGLSYSTDGTTWTSLAAYTNTPTIAAGNNIYFKGTRTPSTRSPYGIGTFSSTGNFTASGTPMSLLFGDDFDGQTSLSGKNYAFQGLFEGCTKLTSIDDLLLPATTLANYCYAYMFDGCTGLTSIPSTLLPATTLAKYCYENMFSYCTGLTSIPSTLLPVTTLVSYCYDSMFRNCTGLTSIPSTLLPAPTLATYCYYDMFAGCTSLTTAPDLPATTLTTKCYAFMFKGCTKLNSIRMLAIDISATDCLTDWVSGVASSGTFYKAAGVTIPTGVSGIPSGWTVIEV